MKDLFKSLKEEIIDSLVICASECVESFVELDVAPHGRKLFLYKQDKDFYALYDIAIEYDLQDGDVFKEVMEGFQPVVVASNWHLSASLIVDIFMLAIKNNYKSSDLVELDN